FRSRAPRSGLRRFPAPGRSKPHFGSTNPPEALVSTGRIPNPVRGRLIMSIKVGDRVPNSTFTVMTSEGPKPKTTDEIFKGKKVVLFAVPGAFTPTCHKNHMPGFVQNAAAIKAKGIDTIAVTGVNDVFVMDAWK